MFYSYDILNPRSGRLSTVWLAANGKLKFKTRQDRDYKSAMSVVVHSICDEILYYIVQHQSVHSYEKKPLRLSLYLSSMLMYGTVTVFRCQVNFLLNDAIEAYKRLLQKTALIAELLDVDLPLGGRVTMRDPGVSRPLLFGTFEDFADLMPPLSLDTNIPHKGRSDVTPKKGRATLSPRPELRSEVGEGESVISHLLGDWGEITPIKEGVSHEAMMPSRSRLEDITLREETLLPSADRREMIQAIDIEPLVVEDLGPPFFMLPDQPFITKGQAETTADEVPAEKEGKEPGREKKAVEKEPGREKKAVEKEPGRKKKTAESEELSERKEKEVIKGKPGEVPEKEEESEKVDKDQRIEAEKGAVLEESKHDKEMVQIPSDTLKEVVRSGEVTPHRPTTPEKVQKRKGKVPPENVDQTLDEEQEKRGRSQENQEHASQMELLPVQKVRTRKGKRPRKLLDTETKISKEDMQRNIHVFGDTMRTKTSAEDIIHVKWWTLMHSADTLLREATHRSALANSLQKLLHRHHKSCAANEHYDFKPSTRHPRLDQSEEAALERLADAASDVVLSDISALTVSRGDSSKSLSTPRVSLGDSQLIPRQIQEGSQLGAIQEEQAVILDPKDKGFKDNEIDQGIKQLESNQVMEVQDVILEGGDVGKKISPGATDVSLTVKSPLIRSPGSSVVPPDSKDAKETDVEKSAKEKDVIKGKGRAIEDHKEAGEKRLGKKRRRHVESEPKMKLPEPEPSHTKGLVDVKSIWPGRIISEAPEDRLRQVSVSLSQEFCIFEQNIESATEAPVEVPKATEETYIQPEDQVFDEGKEISPIRIPHPEIESEKLQLYISAEEVLSDIQSRGLDIQPLTLEDILGSGATRSKVVSVFSCLLELHKQCKVRLSQSTNYGAIFITSLK